MSFTWSYKKPVSKSTLTSGGYTFPSGSPDPTEDILKAQLDELRNNLDSADDNGKIRCSTHNISQTTCSATAPCSVTTSCTTTYSSYNNSVKSTMRSTYRITVYETFQEYCNGNYRTTYINDYSNDSPDSVYHFNGINKAMVDNSEVVARYNTNCGTVNSNKETAF